MHALCQADDVCIVLLFFVPMTLSIMIQSVSRAEVVVEAHVVEHCNQLRARTQPWHSESQVA